MVKLDTKKGLLNVSVSIGFKILLIIANILVRRYLIKYIGNEINGLNSLYLSILEFLSVAELGVGSAIAFCMYKPIVEGDNDKVSALFGLFRKLYLIIGSIIFLFGCAVMPALSYLAKDIHVVNVNLYLTFGLMLISVVITYLFSSKTSLINAYKNNYITTIITSSGMLLQCVLQIIVLIFFKSFVAFLICRIFATLLQWVATEIIAKVKHSDIIYNQQKVDDETRKEVTKNIKAMFMHRIGGVLVNTADSIIISVFIGVVALGKYSNYTSIAIALSGVLVLFFTQLTSVIGHLFIQENKATLIKNFNFFHTFNFILGVVFFLGYYAIIDNFVSLMFGADLVMAKSIAFYITLNYFIQFLKQSTTLFRDATGTFYYDRWKPFLESVVKILLSIFLLKILPEDQKIVGVIIATIIINLLICHTIEPFVLFKYAFNSSIKKYYIKNYLFILLFVISLLVLNPIMIDMHNLWIELICNGFISVGISIVVCGIIVFSNKEFLGVIKSIFLKFKIRKK